MNILAATNFTELATNATAYAAEIAKLTESKLVLFNSFTPSVYALNAQLSAENFYLMFEITCDFLLTKAETLSKQFGIEVIIECSFLPVNEALTLLVDKHKVSLLVLGMKENRLATEVTGETTSSMIKNFPLPTLAISGKAKFKAIRKALLPCGMPKPTLELILKWLREAVAQAEGEVEIFGV